MFHKGGNLDLQLEKQFSLVQKNFRSREVSLSYCMLKL